ncbi:MAG TPA: TetR/AcrR family transcriptional regulator, partial [Mycobacterium sp.]|nr:TetR/AcrR family transcriptional regulator [Mycobacterium sp.]
IASYLTIERDLGRIAADADIDTLAPTLIGAGHLLFADREGPPPDTGAVGKVVTTVIAGVAR